jgi:predicted transcriptional regulator of viral defense system
LNAIAYNQAGYFTAAQAVEAGYSYQAQKHHADRGNWVRVDRGLFRLPRWPTDFNDVFVRWSVWSGGRAVISHESALSVHGLSNTDPTQLHLTVPLTFSPRDSAIQLHKTTLSADEVDQRHGWAVTTPMRTLIDVAEATVSQETINSAVADGLLMGAFSRGTLLRATNSAPPKSALRIERALATAERNP